MQICDICNCSLGEDSKRFTAIQIQKVVKTGFRPPKGPFDEMAESLGAGKDYMDSQWVNQVMSESSDWLLCPKCASRVDKFLNKKSFLQKLFWKKHVKTWLTRNKVDLYLLTSPNCWRIRRHSTYILINPHNINKA